MVALYKYFVVVVIVGGALYFSYDAGYEHAKAACQRERLELIQQHAVELQERLDEIRELEQDWLNEEARIEVRTVYRNKKVIEYVEKTGDSECLDSDGIELFNEISTTSNLP